MNTNKALNIDIRMPITKNTLENLFTGNMNEVENNLRGEAWILVHENSRFYTPKTQEMITELAEQIKGNPNNKLYNMPAIDIVKERIEKEINTALFNINVTTKDIILSFKIDEDKILLSSKIKRNNMDRDLEKEEY